MTNLDRRVNTAAIWTRIFLDFRALFFVAHWVGCIWYIIGDLEYQCVERMVSMIATDGALEGSVQHARPDSAASSSSSPSKRMRGAGGPEGGV